MNGLPTPHVFIGFPSNPSVGSMFILDVSLLDGGDVLAPDDLGLVEVTDRLENNITEPIHIVQGRSSPLNDYETSRLTITFANPDGDLDPLNLLGQYVLAGVSLVELGRRILVTLEDADGNVEPQFGGTIDSYTPGFDTRGWPTMTIEASGPFNDLAQYDPDAASPVGAGELTGARLHRICNNVNIPLSDRSFAAGLETVQATTLAQNALTEARATAAAESPIGGFYENRRGQMQFDARTDILTQTRSKVAQAIFAPPGYGGGSLPYTSLVPTFSKEELRNNITAARIGGAATFIENAASEAKYRIARDKRTDLLNEADPAVVSWATNRLLIYGTPIYRYKTVDVDALAVAEDQMPAMVAALLTRELRDRITVVEQVVYRDDAGDDFTRATTADGFIDRHEQWIGANSWRHSFGLFSADKFPSADHVFTLDVSLLDGTDVLAPL